jgi:hypothetical protein
MLASSGCWRGRVVRPLRLFVNQTAKATRIKPRAMAVTDKLVLQITLGNLGAANIALGALTGWRRP